VANSRTGIPLAFRSAKIALFSPSTTLLAAETEADLFILRQYAEFWKIPYTIRREDASVLVFCSGRPSKTEEPDTPLILSPSGPESASSIAGDLALSVRKEKTRIELPVAPDVVASMQAELYCFMGDKLNPIIHTNGMPILSALSGREIYLLSIDIVNEPFQSVRWARGPAKQAVPPRIKAAPFIPSGPLDPENSVLQIEERRSWNAA